MKLFRLRSCMAAAVFGLASLIPMWTMSALAARPSASVKPATVKVGQKALLTGRNFHKDLWVFLVVVGSFPKPKAERFLGEGRPAKNGTIAVTLKFPLEPVCGKASIYAYGFSAQGTVMKVANVTLTGCRAPSGKPVKPPPPPGGGQKPPKPPKP